MQFIAVTKSNMFWIKPVLLAVLETAISRFLALDADHASLLAPLTGKVIALTMMPFNQTLYLCPSRDGIQILDCYPLEPDTRIVGTLPAFLSMSLADQPMRAVFAGQVTITGDPHTGRRFQRLWQRLNIQPEQQLARYTGDAVAKQVGDVVRSGQAWQQETLHSLRLNTAEFLQEESRDLPAVAEMAHFLAQVDDLRLDFDRLDSRIKRLQFNMPQADRANDKPLIGQER